jgi:carboxypeptidase family protein
MKNKQTETKFKPALCAARNLITSRLLGSILVILVSLVLLSGNAWAGTPAFEGIAKDATGRPIRGGDVRIEARNFSKIVKTGANGHYMSDGLAVGTYKVTLVVNGSVKSSILNAKTQLGKPTQLNFDLTAKTASAKRHTHSVWCPNEIGTHIGGTGQWIDVYDDTGLPVDNNTQPSTATSSIEKVGGSALQTLRTNPGRAHGPFSASGIGGE